MTGVSAGGVTGFSNTTFVIAVVLYVVAALGYFHHLAYRRARMLRIARALAYVGVVVHLSSVVARAIAAGRVPWGNLYEYVAVVGLLMVGSYLVMERVWRTEAVSGFVLGVAVGAMGAATLVYVPPGPLVPALNSYWLFIHVALATAGSALFTVGSVFSVLYLVQERRERTGAVAASVGGGYPVVAGGSGERPDDYVPADPEDAPPASPRRSRLPAAASLDRMAYRAIVFGFPIWTLAVIFGAIWAEQAWGRYWAWDPKEVWAFITWVMFAGYLHSRATVGWRGRRAAVLALAG
ncbi:MAG: c-type cytochrome biogenesis protein CcsB, partial [Actinomycetota bacterium]|nr:c-type cytochrome biogenesis protein CcsB [Actinomycetota bacterium]